VEKFVEGWKTSSLKGEKAKIAAKPKKASKPV